MRFKTTIETVDIKRRYFKTGFVRHFKGGLYFVTDLVRHHEKSKYMVIYTDGLSTYTIPLKNFLSKVDKKKYPDAEQKHRFEYLFGNELKIDEKLEDGVASIEDWSE